MLRSTSIKNDSWKPVKLLARQSVDSPIIDISCDSKGEVAAVLSESELNIFTNRELLTKISFDNGKKVYITEDSQLIFVLSDEKIMCYDSWGQLQWEYLSSSIISKMHASSDGNTILFFSEKFVKVLNRFGEINWEHEFASNILDVSLSQSNELIISVDESLFLVKNGKEITTLKSDINVTRIFCSFEYLILISDNTMISLSYGGVELWQKEIASLEDLSFSSKGIKQIFLRDFKNVICQDRNGDELWSYNSTDNLSSVHSLESGTMTGFHSNNVFHVVDEIGEQAWTYQAREEIVDFTFSIHGGDIILASKHKIHWFQNEGFLRLAAQTKLEKAKQLISKVSVYESSIDDIHNDIEMASSLHSGNYGLLRESFHILDNVNMRLSLLQKRHVEYLDSLPHFMKRLGLQGAQTDDMIPFLYPYFSLYSDLQDTLSLRKLLESANYFLLKLNRYEPTSVNDDENKNTQRDAHFLKSAKKGIIEEIANIEGLISSIKHDIQSLESKLREMILDWLKTGQVDTQLRNFLNDYYRSNEIRQLKQNLVKDKLDNHMAFVDYSDSQSLLALGSFSFNCNNQVNLSLNLQNKSSEIVRNIILRIKLEGSGLNLSEPVSGVLRFEHLNPNETISPVFLLNPVNRTYARIVMVVQYQDSAGRKYTNWFGEMESNFLGCYVQPLEISEKEHGDFRLDFKDFNSHAVLNIEGLTINRITSISKEIPGMYLCNFKEESSRSIIYHSAKSSLDDSYYFSMIFLRKIGGEESLRNVLELICHSSDLTKSSEIRDEIISYLKIQLLASNGRLV